jgi:diguanylate cyclase (GGDEF)-like protein
MEKTGVSMTDRMALLEAALDSLPDGVALLDREGGLVFWNQAAEAITGYRCADLVASPEALQPLLKAGAGEPPGSDRGALVRPRHQLGHELPLIARMQLLQNGLGEQLGIAILFHPAERLDALPHGESDDNVDVQASQADMEERLQTEFEDFERGGEALGVLWIGVDQGPELRKTHGVAACQAMVDKVRRPLATGLRPAEELGRWGDNEFLVIAHERTAEMLASRARTLTGLARTADFRWWGDRLSLTVSIGAAQAEPGDTLARLLKRASRAMETGTREGGNRVTVAQRRMEEEMECITDAGGQS